MGKDNTFKMKHLSIYILLFLAVISCRRNDISSLEYYRDVPDLSRLVDSSDSMISGISLTPVKVDSVETSFVGFFWIDRDTLYFSDDYYNYIFKLRTDGSVIRRLVGRGQGPNEVAHFSYSIPIHDGYYLYSESNSVAYQFDKEWNKIGFERVRWTGKNGEGKRRVNRPKPDEAIFYTPFLMINEGIQQWDSKHVAMNVSTELNNLNGFDGSGRYYKYVRTLALINIETSELDGIFGRRPPIYIEKANIPSMDHMEYVVVDDMVLASFYPDSTIYMLDRVNDCAIGKFGRQGRDMNTNYIRTRTIEEGLEREDMDWEIFGYYDYIKYDKKRELLFRGYKRGDHTEYDGLQIYKKYALIGDIDVPKGFKIIGYCNDKLIASIEDIEVKELALYFYLVDFNE